MLQVASVLSGCCICFTHMLQLYVKCFVCFRLMLHSSVLFCKCFVFQRYIQRESLGHGPGVGGKGCACLRSCRWGVLVLIPAPESHTRGERRGGQGEEAAGAGRDETDEDGVRVHGGMRQTGKDYSNSVGVRRISAGRFRTIPWNSIL